MGRDGLFLAMTFWLVFVGKPKSAGTLKNTNYFVFLMLVLLSTFIHQYLTKVFRGSIGVKILFFEVNRFLPI
jgi:hypothetical protein